MESRIKEWQEKYEDAKNHDQSIVANINDNDEAYRGVRKIKNPQGEDAKKQGCVSRKMCFELVETQADIVIPMPRVLSKKGREDRALMIENVIRNELDRLPIEAIIDEQARITPKSASGSPTVVISQSNNPIMSEKSSLNMTLFNLKS